MRFQHLFVLPLVVTFLLGHALTVSAQGSQIMSVTPPLFQLSVLPGDIWQSAIKVVNGNPYPMTVYAEVVNFEAMGESGQGRFIPVMREEGVRLTLAEWIEIAPGPHVIPPEQSKDVSFFVEVPKDAPPGGHYAAVLITTKPPVDETEEFAVQTSQAVTSLFLMRIEGDVIESGSIREFSVLDAFVPRPQVEFSLRFENKGNVHLQPRGDIVITNMWGTKRGVIPINSKSHFGNVLPESIRDFKFLWESDLSIADVGRYKAVVTLGYGEDGVQNESAVTYFWVVPVKLTLITLLTLGLIITLIVWMVRMYIRRVLQLAGVPMGDGNRPQLPGNVSVARTPSAYKAMSAPIRDGVLDLRKKLNENRKESVLEVWLRFVTEYKRFFLSLVLLIGIGFILAGYFGKATDENNEYRVIIEEAGKKTLLEPEAE